MKRCWLIALTLGGAAMTAFKPEQQHNLMRLPSFHGLAEVRASLPGRIRLYMPSIAQRPEQAMQMKEKLESTGAVRQAVLNFRTSTVLLGYDESQVEAAVVQGAAMKLMGLDEAMGKAPVSRMEAGVKTLTEAVNHGVMQATGGLLDAKMLAGCALTLAGVYKLAACGAAAPGAMTLLWWASSLFGRGAHGQD
ncbi:MAG: hypothetical protein Q4G52_07425 [Clostridia bacterium]|nr:hypothetical protein [Clostridia bacterium]